MRLEFAPKLSDRETQFLDRLATLGCLDVGTFRRLERMLVETGERLVALVLKLGVLSEQRLLTELSALSGVDVLRASHLPNKAAVVPGLNLALLRAREVVPIAVDSRFVYAPRADSRSARTAIPCTVRYGHADGSTPLSSRRWPLTETDGSVHFVTDV